MAKSRRAARKMSLRCLTTSTRRGTSPSAVDGDVARRRAEAERRRQGEQSRLRLVDFHSGSGEPADPALRILPRSLGF